MLLVICTDGWKLNTTTEGVVGDLSEMRRRPGRFGLSKKMNILNFKKMKIFQRIFWILPLITVINAEKH